MDALKVLDVVAVTENLPSAGLVGTVVEEWEDGVFKVEFSDDSGEAYGLLHCAPTN